MSELTVKATFTITTAGRPGEPATGLTLADIGIFLTRENRLTGALTVVWDGTVIPTAEIANIGAYIRILSNADENLYIYHMAAQYNGAAVLDADWAYGSSDPGIRFPIGAVEFTYTVTNSATLAPIDGVEVWFSTDNPAGGLNDVDNVVWTGVTDAFGIARDLLNNLPQLDAGTYFVWRQKSGFAWTDPDTEVVSL